ncbi:phospholipase D-like domain-containing protein [Cyanothece sp. BG0011]|uniref:phospholipase D-like domain-containing protein n=1 Tax=Cyanothece sp. BG0011 TaxID=2082950 RepID=UPI000D1F5DA7|nr:phospholipase D-like domain-containing protein [Cyanothece sp. BG0011]
MKLLQLLETTGLILSIIGSLQVSLQEKPIIHATGPLTATIAINIINRRNLRKETRQLYEKLEKSQHYLQQSEHTISHLSSLCDQLEMKHLDNNLTLHNNFSVFSQKINEKIDNRLKSEISDLNLLIKENFPHYQYELIYNRRQSRQTLLNALQEAKDQLILVCPWLTTYAIDDEVLTLMKEFLSKRKGQLKIGWGNRKDIKKFLQNSHRQSSACINRQLFYRFYQNNFFYKALPQLERLEKRFPGQVQLKLIGTHEKYFVCDHNFAVLGSHNFLCSNDSSLQQELGLKTNDPKLLDKMKQRFQESNNFETDLSKLLLTYS